MKIRKIYLVNMPPAGLSCFKNKRRFFNLNAILFACALLVGFHTRASAQHSVARQWNEAILRAISNDLARPTVHARNLFHTSAAMYDAWAVYAPHAQTYFLGKEVHGFHWPMQRVVQPENIRAAQEEAMSYAVYRLIRHRFAQSPGARFIMNDIAGLMKKLGYDTAEASRDYVCSAAGMGNYIADGIIAYGLQDGSNESRGYANQYYRPVNPPLTVEVPGNPTIKDLNRWQPLKFARFVDQSGNVFENVTPAFLGPEWGNVAPFSLSEADMRVYSRDGSQYKVYHDPGPPPNLDTTATGGLSEEYKWGHTLVSIWSSLLDTKDNVKIDVSPASIGNNTTYPSDIKGMRDFYNLFEGGDDSPGHAVNPKTGAAYTPQIVARGDYYRVLAEFWADGPASVTPPGHWFEIMNYVNDQPGLVRKMRGQGPLLDTLEWDVKSYFALGGAMHDVAITAWGIKGWYDSSRPVSAIRGMAELGQSSDPSQPSYHPGGMPLIPGYVELIKDGDPLEGFNKQYIGKIKIWAWRGPIYINDPRSDIAGVGWIRAANWWPYQRPTFVTPPFAGYISGHSTYSRAGAELLTALTGDPFFPGGMGEFRCRKNEYLVFEDGPSSDVTLQWATYRDASDQCSLSRIFGGIHPPADDIPGRLIGIKIGPAALDFAERYFRPDTLKGQASALKVFPNPTHCAVQIAGPYEGQAQIDVYDMSGRLVQTAQAVFEGNQTALDVSLLRAGVYTFAVKDPQRKRLFSGKIMRMEE